ncbi:hypothetical protein Gocc_0325 [Gaiella occulta]|uniref:Uncharacterized protein n=1 Tax=Gaiella occulta TaxID=1002870 RepID=A0A7M2Z0G6_9ACTN|nr:hypothetical protein Gocc_0325 [Gaiella occulta]
MEISSGARPPAPASGPRGRIRATIRSVKRALAWVAGLAGIAALGRLLARRGTTSQAPAPAPAEPLAGEDDVDPAEVLRRKLAAQRSGPAEGEQAETLDERRARIHARAQETIASMRDGEDRA